jgi:hypothetical protein
MKLAALNISEYFGKYSYTVCKISVSLSFVTLRGEGKLERARGEQDTLCAVASPPSPYLSWLATNVCICNSQQNSEISCDKYN